MMLKRERVVIIQIGREQCGVLCTICGVGFR